jgi:hypothetical protein
MQAREVKTRVGCLLTVIVVGAVVLLTRWGGTARPVLYEIPGGFRGWVTISYRTPGCAPLHSEGLWVVVQIPSSGHACTASGTGFPAFHLVRYVYVYPGNQRIPLLSTIKGGGGMIWSALFYDAKENVTGRPVEGFFVGPEDEIREYLDSKPRPQQPIPPATTPSP